MILKLPGGVGHNVVWNHQGFIDDGCTAASVPWSVSKGIVLRVF